MWIGFAFGSAFFAGITSILAKCGIQKTDSNVATAIRTIVVLLFAWIMVFVVGSQDSLRYISPKTLFFLILSGLTTGASWLCYFRALQLANVNQVVPIDKSSTVLTILFAMIFLGEPVDLWKVLGIVGISIGIYLMIPAKTPINQPGLQRSWLVYAFLSAIFASLTTILGKIGITGIESNLGTAIRTGVVLIMAWTVVFASGKRKTVSHISKKELAFLLLSGMATGVSWLCYYKALQDGYASVVVPIDKLSILVSIAFSSLILKEKLSKRAGGGLAFITAGTVSMLFSFRIHDLSAVKIDHIPYFFYNRTIKSKEMTL